MVSRTLTSFDGIRVRSWPQISISGLGNDQKPTTQLCKHNHQDSSWLAFESPWISHQYPYSNKNGALVPVQNHGNKCFCTTLRAPPAAAQCSVQPSPHGSTGWGALQGDRWHSDLNEPIHSLQKLFCWQWKSGFTPWTEKDSLVSLPLQRQWYSMV